MFSLLSQRTNERKVFTLQDLVKLLPGANPVDDEVAIGGDVFVISSFQEESGNSTPGGNPTPPVPTWPDGLRIMFSMGANNAAQMSLSGDAIPALASATYELYDGNTLVTTTVSGDEPDENLPYGSANIDPTALQIKGKQIVIKATLVNNSFTPTTLHLQTLVKMELGWNNWSGEYIGDNG